MALIAVISPSPLIRAGLVQAVGAHPGLELAGTAASLEEWRGGSVRADVVIVDAPEGPLSFNGEPAVVLLSADGGSVDPGWLRHGPIALLARDAGIEEIGLAAAAVARGLTVLGPTAAQGVGSALPSVSPTGADVLTEPLTQRELEVLGLLAEGLSNKALANRLGLSEHTAKFHVGQILGKLGAASRAEAVALGLKRGLVGL